MPSFPSSLAAKISSSNSKTSTPNLKFAHDVIHPRMMEYLMTMTGSGLSFVLPGDCVMAFNKVALDISAVDPMIAVCNQIMDKIPAHVYQDFA